MATSPTGYVAVYDGHRIAVLATRYGPGRVELRNGDEWRAHAPLTRDDDAVAVLAELGFRIPADEVGPGAIFTNRDGTWSRIVEPLPADAIVEPLPALPDARPVTLELADLVRLAADVADFALSHCRRPDRAAIEAAADSLIRARGFVT
jgi:hypothetical protein